MQVVHFAKPNNLEPNTSKNRQKFAKSPNQNIYSQTLSKFARFPKSGDKFANMATLNYTPPCLANLTFTLRFVMS